MVIISLLLLSSILPANLSAVLAKPAVTTIAVDTTTDDPTLFACTGSGGDCSLRGAVDHVNADLGTAYIIQIPDGTYTLNHDSANATEDLNASGDLDITNPDVTLQGTSMTGTLLNGNDTDRVIDLIGSDKTLIINDLTIYNGTLLTGEGGGGGLFLHNNNIVTLNRVTIRDNEVQGTTTYLDIGGGIFNRSSHLTINNSHIAFNQAYQGGGIASDGTIIEINNSEFVQNTAGDVGGGLVASPGGTYTISGCLFDGNIADRGGGIRLSTATLILMNSILQNNHAHTSGGGLDLYGMVMITNVTLYHNTTEGSGGGITTREGTGASLLNMTLVDNAATQHGGGIYAMGGSVVSLDYLTFSGNTAGFQGDGIHVGYGANVYTMNTIFTAPTTGKACYIFDPGNDWVTEGYNLSSDTSCSLSGTGDQPGLDPKFGTYGNHGGLTPTLSLLFNSPAIDKGNPADYPGHSDQRGIYVMGGRSDIGAYEFVPPSTWMPLIMK